MHFSHVYLHIDEFLSILVAETCHFNLDHMVAQEEEQQQQKRGKIVPTSPVPSYSKCHFFC
jgi:hypothetical protein